MYAVNKAENIGEMIRGQFLHEDLGGVPCVFISYQREDEKYAKEISDFIRSSEIDVYFDLNDLNLIKMTNPNKVTEAILKGLNSSDYMIVIVSPTTSDSPWVPFEIGYAFDRMEDKMKILRHKEIDKNNIPDYMRTRDILQGFKSLNGFIRGIKNENRVYESLTESVKTFSSFHTNPLNKYLDDE